MPTSHKTHRASASHRKSRRETTIVIALQAECDKERQQRQMACIISTITLVLAISAFIMLS